MHKKSLPVENQLSIIINADSFTQLSQSTSTVNKKFLTIVHKKEVSELLGFHIQSRNKMIFEENIIFLNI
jgi:hypothetical protein